MAQDKKVFADGAVIFREGDSGEDVFELISGAVDLLVKRDGKYAREQAIQSGSSFGGDSDTTSGIRLFTARANGRAVVRSVQANAVPALIPIPSPTESSPGILNRLMQTFSGSAANPQATPQKQTYSNPGLLRRLIEGAGTDYERIGIRVARLSGPDGEKHSRHIISAIGNTQELQTRGINKVLSINQSAGAPSQLARLAGAARQFLADQSADLLVWGSVLESGTVMHLHFVARANWDQQAPGAFQLETTLALPIDFSASMADLLRTVCLAAVLPKTADKRQMRTSALFNSLNTANTAFNNVPNDFSNREKSCLHLCYGNAIAAASMPGYNPELLSKAETQYQLALGNLDLDTAPVEWAQVKKHLSSITHIEAERNHDPQALIKADLELTEALAAHTQDRHGQAWAILQNRLGLVSYRLGFDDENRELLRRALRCFQLALRVYTKDHNPLRWAEIMSHFAQAAQVLGGLQQSPDALATAVNACRNVLEVRDFERAPKAWAASQSNLGSALFLLGKHTRSINRLEASLAAFKSALEVYQKLGATRMAATTQKNLDRAKDMVEIYQPRNVTQLDWENALAEGIQKNKQEIPIYDIVDLEEDDDLPWPYEVLKSKTA